MRDYIQYRFLLRLLVVVCSLGTGRADIDLQRVYRIGTDNTYPYHFLDKRGEVQGMVGEVIQEAARRSGVRLRWYVLQKGPHAALSDEDVDLWPLLAVQRDLWPNIYFTAPYLSNTFVSVGIDESPVSWQGRTHIKRVASARFPLVLKMVRDVFPLAASLGFANRQDAMSAVCRGSADIAVMEARALQFLALRRPAGCEGKSLFTLGLDVKARQLAIASLKEPAPVADRLRSEIDRMLADGSMENIMRRWNYFYGGEAETLYREAEARHANGLSYLFAAGLAALSLLLFTQLVRIRRAQQAAVAADSSKSMFLANMSHEIRTPMNGVIGMVQLALAVCRDDEARGYLTIAKNSAGSLLTLLNDILDLSRIEAGKLSIDPSPLDPLKLVHDVVQLLEGSAHAKGLTIVLDSERSVARCVLLDTLRMQQVLMNLLGNAIKFTERGQVTIRISGNTSFLSFSIRDTGIGIPRDQQKSIFDAFTQADGSIARKYGGTGLGLAITGRLVRLMGGSIQVQSEPGAGTVFDVRIPYRVSTQKVDLTKYEVPVAPVVLKPKRVLVAEDNVVNQRVASGLLEKIGHSVVVVSNGVEALEMLRGERFDVVLMDVQMPEMDGLEATAAIRRGEVNSKQHLPIIALTAHAMSGDRVRCLEAGMDGYVSKPIQLEELLQAIHATEDTFSPANEVPKEFPASLNQS